jgi:hypothetical protein
MKTKPVLPLAGVLVLTLLCTGCATKPVESRVTNPNQPGPAVGNAVGTAVGTVGGNVAGAVVAAGEGATTAVKSTFTNEHHIVRTWHTETTSDGRTIQVPVDIEVDENGKPIAPPEAKPDSK